MTWLDMANLLFEKSNALSPRGAHLHLDTAAWLRTWTSHQNQTADAAAQIFARTRAWPEIPEEIGCQLYFRCLFALEACIRQDAEQAIAPQDVESALEELLVDGWHERGLEWAEQRYSARPRAYAKA